MRPRERLPFVIGEQGALAYPIRRLEQLTLPLPAICSILGSNTKKEKLPMNRVLFIVLASLALPALAIDDPVRT